MGSLITQLLHEKQALHTPSGKSLVPYAHLQIKDL